MSQVATELDGFVEVVDWWTGRKVERMKVLGRGTQGKGRLVFGPTNALLLLQLGDSSPFPSFLDSTP